MCEYNFHLLTYGSFFCPQSLVAFIFLYLLLSVVSGLFITLIKIGNVFLAVLITGQYSKNPEGI